MRLSARIALSFVAAAMALAAAVSLHAQAKPNFSGVWTMVPEKSDFGGMAAPAKMTRTITHTEPMLKVVTVQQGGPNGDTTIETTFSTDGKPRNNVVTGMPMTTIGKWEQGTIVLASIAKSGDVEVAVEDRYTLSDAGKTLTILRKIVSSEGGVAQKFFLIKK